MKNKTSKFVMSLLAALCLAVPMFVGSIEIKAADDTYKVEPYDVSKAQTYFTNDEAPACETNGYIFAGWYAKSDEMETITREDGTTAEYFKGNPLSSLDGYNEEQVKALFVKAEVLGVKAQIALDDNDENYDVVDVNANNATRNIRFITSVDSLKYKQVGFEIFYTYGGVSKAKDSITNYVYKNLTVVNGGDDESETLMPHKVFSPRSQYFKACTVTDIPIDAFEMGFDVRTFWTTADGAKVYGSSTEVIKTVQEGINATYEASVGNTYYKVLEDAVASVGDTDTKTVTLIKDAEVASDMVVKGNVTITNRKGANVAIYRASNLTNENVLSVESGAKLNIVGTTGMDSIVLDGNKVEATVPMVHSNAGVLFIQNATLQNATCKGDSVGGAIFAQGATDLDVNNVKFIGNAAVNGAAIRVANGATAYITTSVFGEEGKVNSATNDGGAIYSQAALVEIEESQFLYNTAVKYGGAICLNGSPRALEVKNSKFVGNSVTGTNGGGGAVFGPGKSTLTFIAENDVNELAVFENNSSSGTGTSYSGGAIYAGGTSLTVTGYKFIRNSAAYQGGAIHGRYGTIKITSAKFEDNYTTGDASCGGAVTILAKKGTIKDTVFTENYTEGKSAHGGAVYLATGNAATTTFSDCDCTGNFVNEAAGAVNTNGSELEGVYIAQ